MKKILLILTLSCLVLISGCQPSISGRTLSASDYLQLASLSSGHEKQQLELQAASRYLDEQQTNLSLQILNSMTTQSMSLDLFVNHQLLLAKAKMNSHDNNTTNSILQNLNSASLTTNQRKQQLNLLAINYEQQGNIIESIDQRTYLLNIENQQERKDTLINIWMSLQSTSPTTINKLTQQNLSNNIQGWLLLSNIINNSAHSNLSTTQELTNWQHQFPQHAANALLPSNLAANQNDSTPTHIALLLPLTGENSDSAQAIRNGFLTAYYYAKKQSSRAPTISVIDTSKESIDKAYNNAVAQGADFIVGPLTKTNLATLIKSQRITVPTLALNTLDNTKRINNLYQFGLSPLDETAQLVKKADSTKHHNALIIAPNTSWGQNISNRLRQEWEQQGGSITATMNYSSRNQLSADIKQLLNIQYSYNRGYAIRNILNDRKIRIVSRRRQDFDSIFLIAQPSFAKQIQPLLKFYFAGDIPVYATSQLYDGRPGTASNKDLNNILFCDMPWVITAQSLHPQFLNTLQQQSKQVWPTSYANNTKLYALGVDAFNLTYSLQTMILLPDFGNKAATGTLYLDQNNHIYRELQWAQFTNGRPTTLYREKHGVL